MKSMIIYAKILFVINGFFLFILPAMANGQVLCELSLNSCVDYNSSDNIDITAPSNTTRIAEEPLSVCLIDSTEKRAVDLVFVVDKSGSMKTNDPQSRTPPAVRAAINFLNTQSPTSNVGFIAFGNGLCDGTGSGSNLPGTLVPLAPLSVNFPLIEGQTNYDHNDVVFDCGSKRRAGTEYIIPLTQAGSWLSAYGTQNSKIIIFLTDGNPTTSSGETYAADFAEFVDSLEQNNLESTMPSVYAMFIGGSNNNLTDLANMTGGTSISGLRPDDISSTMQSIIEREISALPLLTSVKNIGTSFSGSATVHSQVGTSNEYNMTLSNVVALNEGINTVQFSTNIQTPPNFSAQSVISVTGAPISDPNYTRNIGIFRLTCRNAGKIEFSNENFTQTLTDKISFQETGFGVTVNTDITLAPGETIAITEGLNTVLTLDNNKRAVAGPAKLTLGSTIKATWVNKYDPRDIATGTIIVEDLTEEQAQITFKKLDGTPITASISDNAADSIIVELSYNKPYLGTSFTVRLATNTGDALDVVVKQTEPGSQIYRSYVPFGFSAVISADDKIIQGKLNINSSTNSDVITATFKSFTGRLNITSGFAPISSVWIIDGDENGQVDTIYIQYSANLAENSIPKIITSIDWPANTIDKGFTATYNNDPSLTEISFVKNPDGSVNRSLVMVVLKGKGEVFEKGVTGPDPSTPPKLTIDGAEFLIGDKAKPVLIDAVKIPSNNALYIQGSTNEVKVFPDTLLLTFSEEISLQQGFSGNPMDNFLYFVSEDGNPVKVTITGQPIVQSDGKWKVVVDNLHPEKNPMVGDNVYISSTAPYQDAAENKMGSNAPKTEGENSRNAAFFGDFITNISSTEKAISPLVFKPVLVPILDDNGMVIGEKKLNREVDYSTQFVPPVQMNENGEIDPGIPCNQNNDTRPKVDFPAGCLSVFALLTEQGDGPYSVSVAIYTHLGHFVRGWIQNFGKCGELGNPERQLDTKQFINPLVWNQRDDNGYLVGDGVYIWQMKAVFANGKSKEKVKKMGIVRSKETDNQCPALIKNL